MGTTNGRSLNEKRTAAVMRQIAANVKADKRVSVVELTNAVDIERSMYYRWQDPDWAADVTLKVLADMADYLERNYQHPSFIAMWQQAVLDVH